MARGMIFSTDAALALITVIILVAWLPQQLNAGEEKGGAFENLHDQALDRAVMGFYDGLSGDSPDFENFEFVRCVEFHTIDSDNILGTRDSPDTENFCRVV